VEPAIGKSSRGWGVVGVGKSIAVKNIHVERSYNKIHRLPTPSTKKSPTNNGLINLPSGPDCLTGPESFNRSVLCEWKPRGSPIRGRSQKNGPPRRRAAEPRTKSRSRTFLFPCSFFRSARILRGGWAARNKAAAVFDHAWGVCAKPPLPLPISAEGPRSGALRQKNKKKKPPFAEQEIVCLLARRKNPGEVLDFADSIKNK